MIFIITKLFFKDFRGLAIYPFVFFREKELKNDAIIVNHERIHLRQQIELLWIFFFILYVFEFIFNYIRLKNLHLAYMNISFEKEAYKNQNNLKYLKDRKFWSFLKYY
ncbi:MAG: hypothetical protein H6604_04640 [Flavobacteriales bacterium]|nr:hypothetical protein [Flavobacteriales bacterium]